MAAGNTYVALATQTLASAASSVTFTGISQSYTDLILVAKCAGTSGGAIQLRVGTAGSADTGSNYSYTNIIGNGSSATSGRASSTTAINLTQGNQFTPSTLGNVFTFHIQNYSNTNTYKTILNRSSVVDSSSGFASSTVGLWRNTAAIDTVQMISNDTYIAGSTFSLYGIAAA